MKYDFDYRPDTPYGHMVQLVRDHVEPGVIIDLGCGNAAIAAPLRDLGFTYVGVDVDPTSLAALSERGEEVHCVDLRAANLLADALERVAGGRRIVAITALDVIEHLDRPLDVLRAIHGAMASASIPWLGISIPNVTHFDLAAKQLSGRWDVTPVGLLDETHVSLFSARRLQQDMARSGFLAGPVHDFERRSSDQAYPADLPTLAPASMLSRLLREVRMSADEHAFTNQFVRLFRLGEIPASAPDATEPGPFLSVILRTRGTRPTLSDTLTCLAAQTDDDFEVLLMIDAIDDADAEQALQQLEPFDVSFRSRVRVERLRGHDRVPPLNRGVEMALGRYVVILDDDDLVFANWVEDFHATATHAAGAVLRSRAVTQEVRRTGKGISDLEPVSGFRLPYEARFDFMQHLRNSQSPPHTIALPLEALRSLGIRFDPELEVLEDLDVFLRTAAWCGVVDTLAITAVYRRWTDDEASVNAIPWSTWERAKARIIHRLDATPMLMPEGTSSRLFFLLFDVETLRERAELAEAKVEALERSRSWRITRPLRAVSKIPGVRRVGRRVANVVRGPSKPSR